MSWNKQMMTVEDANSINYHFGKGFIDYYILDTRNLTAIDTLFGYDFVEIYILKDVITFKIKNSLWTGGFKIIDCNVDSPTINADGNTIIVSDDELDWVVILLEISPDFNHNETFELEYQVKYDSAIRPCCMPPNLLVSFYDGETPISNLDVIDVNWDYTYVTDENGKIEVTTSENSKGKYIRTLETDNNGETVRYVVPYIFTPIQIPIRIVNDKIYRDKNNRLTFELIWNDDLPIDENWFYYDNEVKLKLNGETYELDFDLLYDSGRFWFDVPIGLKEYIDIELEIRGNTYIDSYVKKWNLRTDYVTIDNSEDLKNEIESDLSAKTIIFNGDELNSPITIDKNINLIFEGNPITSNLNSIFDIVEDVDVKVNNINFTGKKLVNIENGNLEIANSIFQHCTGTVIKGKGNLDVEKCSFIDNYNCINIEGNVDIFDTIFELSDVEYLDTTTPAFVTCFKDLNVNFSQFTINLEGLTTLGFSYIMFYLGKNGTSNKVKNNLLFKNNGFKFLKNTTYIDIESEHYHISSNGNKSVVWTIEDTNTVFNNNLNIEYVGGDD